MNPRRILRRCRLAVGLMLFVNLVLQSSAVAQGANIYSAGFAHSEGFDSRFTLIGQVGWTGTDANGNGILTNYFTSRSPQPSFGQQQAFVGGYYYSYPLTNLDGTLNVWRPLDFDPLAAGLPIVTFSVRMAIYDSFFTATRDCFRWSVYNKENGGTRLFTIDFDNTTLKINY